MFVGWLSLGRHVGNGLDGAKYAIYVALIAGVVEVAAAWIALRTLGEHLPRFGAGDTDSCE